MDTFDQDATYVSSEQVRDALGAHLDQVHDNGLLLHITTGGTPDGALAPLPRLAEIGLTPVAEHGIRAARTHWGALRTRAGTDGPQGIARHKNLLAVLVDQTTAIAIIRRTRMLDFIDLILTDDGIMLADNEPVAPGTYILPGGRTAHIEEPRQKETSMRPSPHTSDTVLWEVLEETAAEAAAMYMHARRATTDPALREELMEKGKEAWKYTRTFDLTREEMIEHIQRLQREIDRKGQA
ncbi:hypothetical protein ACFW4K_22330 [Nocardiopsis alba]|uniref:hypothetical protein n=1 Tax=Nocardiopsis alba TaxID=53437 RepID=UPI0035E0545D